MLQNISWTSLQKESVIDLREIIKEVADGGGHSNACGAFINKDNEKKFIEDMESALNKLN